MVARAVRRPTTTSQEVPRGVGQGLGRGNYSTSARTSTSAYVARHGRSASDSRATSWSFSDTGKGDSAAPAHRQRPGVQLYAVQLGRLDGEAERAARRVPDVGTHSHGIGVTRCIRPREGLGYEHQRPGVSGGRGRRDRAQGHLGC